jgi:hypothetical protein
VTRTTLDDLACFATKIAGLTQRGGQVHLRWKAAGVTLAQALRIPAAPAVAQTGTPRVATASCQTIVVYTPMSARWSLNHGLYIARASDCAL